MERKLLHGLKQMVLDQLTKEDKEHKDGHKQMEEEYWIEWVGWHHKNNKKYKDRWKMYIDK